MQSMGGGVVSMGGISVTAQAFLARRVGSCGGGVANWCCWHRKWLPALYITLSSAQAVVALHYWQLFL
jgi:hypothetical protein